MFVDEIYLPENKMDTLKMDHAVGYPWTYSKTKRFV